MIKILTLNMFEGGILFDNIIKFLSEEKPDILCLQEVYNGNNKNLAGNLKSMRVLRNLLPDFDFFYSPELLDNRKEGKIDLGNAIFSRFPMKKKKTIFINSYYDKKWVREEKKGDFTSSP